MDWWHTLSVFWKTLAAILGGIAIIAAAWKPVATFWSWCVSKYDEKVLNLLKGRDRMAQAMKDLDVSVVSVGWISNVAKRGPKWVVKSLQRLELQEKVHEVIPIGWTFGTRKEKLEIQKLQVELTEHQKEARIKEIMREMDLIERQIRKEKKVAAALLTSEEDWFEYFRRDDPNLVTEAMKRRTAKLTIR